MDKREREHLFEMAGLAETNLVGGWLEIERRELEDWQKEALDFNDVLDAVLRDMAARNAGGATEFREQLGYLIRYAQALIDIIPPPEPTR